MNEFICKACAQEFKSEEKPQCCPSCGDDTELFQTCPMCGSVIDSDTKVCPECKETVA